MDVIARIVSEMRKYQAAPTGVIPAKFAQIWADQLDALASSGAPPQKKQEEETRVVGFPEMEHGDLPQPPTK